MTNTQKQIFDDFYKLGDPTAQDQVLMDNIQIHEKARMTMTVTIHKSDPTKTHDRQITVRYYLQINAIATEVCKSMFQNVFGCGRGKVDTIILKKKTSISGICSKSFRGSHKPHNSNIENRENILSHIKSFPAYDSHYSRKRTVLKYLSPVLNIQKMYELYKED